MRFAERPADRAGLSDSTADGLLVLHHGRGADEHDLLGLGEALDPQRRLHIVTPRAPLTVTGWPGHHWYVVPQVGFPDPASFRSALAQLAAFHDQLWERTETPPERTVFGGFSMGTVMSYAAGLTPGRPAPAGILALSGFVPTVDGWQPDLAGRPALRAFIAHGRRDATIPVTFARQARELLTHGGIEVEYHETDAGHYVDPSYLPSATAWVERVLAPTAAR